MKTIEIDLDVFAAIWAGRISGEASENDVLRRLLLKSTDFKENSDDGGTPEVDVPSYAPLEVKTSESVFETKPKGELTMGKIRWVDDIQASLAALGGKSSLHSIYKAVEKRRRLGGRSTPRTIDAVIRRTLEDHSSDSANFRGEDIFALIGRGEWALR